jgi:predicted CoA-substrate-specific enzyme activase
VVSEINLSKDTLNIQNFEGLEVGAVSVKWVRRTMDGKVIHKIIRHEGKPLKKIKEILSTHKTNDLSKIAITGQAAKRFLSLPYYSEVECLEKALSYLNIKPDILVSLGGETFSIYPMKDGIVKNIISSSKCAAGTGEFIVQQFQRMGLTIKEGIKASSDGEFTQLATRCSVHCKSDATHKLNKGVCQSADIAKTLIFDLARKVSEMIDLAQWSKNLIVVAGGVTSNSVLIENLRELLSNSEVLIFPESPYLEVFGASLYAAEITDESEIPPFEQWFSDSKTVFETHEPLKNNEDLLDYRVKSIKSELVEGGTYILGIDAGSTTTKAVLYDVHNGIICASSYLRTLGNPIAATKNCLTELIEQMGDKNIRIIQAGSTGSAREMVSVYLNNCRSFNEILTHARAATEEVADVDTVFEIGGQDSKFISFLKGIPVDYAMNEGCSAGTGSFLEESASVDMGIEVTKISEIAEKSANPIAFGERCAAFINTDVRDALQQGSSREDVIAGLVYSIADNYISRIVGPRQLGETILFLGGVALNRSVALAMAARSKRKIVVPAYPELMGAVGTALMLKDRIDREDISERDYSLKPLVKGQMEMKNVFRCKACDNNCEIQRISIRGKTYPFGGNCSKYTLLREKGDHIKEGKNIIDIRNKLMFEEWNLEPLKNPLGTVGLPMVLSVFDLFPFYAKLFNDLNFKIVLSKPSKVGNTKTCASICYPCELVHGAVYDLLNQDVDYIFLPYVLEFENPVGARHSYTCVSTGNIPDIISAAFTNIRSKLLSPHIGLKKNLIRTTLKEIEKMGIKLGASKKQAKNAGKDAMSYFFKFKEVYTNLGGKILEELKEKPTIVIAGRPYTLYDPDVNLALPRKIISRGYNVIPLDLLPQLNNNIGQTSNVWTYTQQIYNCLSYVKENPNMYVCFMSCFSCGPDSIAYHLFRNELEGSLFCYLEIDSHTAHAGFDTRVGAFLDIIEERQKKTSEIS